MLNVSPFIICLNKCDWYLAWILYGFSDFVGALTLELYFQPNWSNPPYFHNEHHSNNFLPKNFYGHKNIKFDHTRVFLVLKQCWLKSLVTMLKHPSFRGTLWKMEQKMALIITWLFGFYGDMAVICVKFCYT